MKNMKIHANFSGLIRLFKNVYYFVFTILMCITKISSIDVEPTTTTSASTTTTITDRSELDKDFCTIKNSDRIHQPPVVKLDSAKPAIHCNSTEQINWLFNDVSAFSVSIFNTSTLPFTVTSRMTNCNDSGNSNSSSSSEGNGDSPIRYYFQSTLEFKKRLFHSHSYQGGIPVNYVVCGWFTPSGRSNASPLSGADVIIAASGTVTLQKSDHNISSLMQPKSPCDSVVLDHDEKGGCRCQRRGIGQPFEAHLTTCDNVVDCLFLAQRGTNKRNPPCDATKFENNCNRPAFQSVEFAKSGFLFCTRAKNAVMPFVPFLPAPQQPQQQDLTNKTTRLTTINVIGNNASDYGKFLELSVNQASLKGPGVYLISRRTGGEINCTGPQFLFLQEFYWTVKLGDLELHQNKKNSKLQYKIYHSELFSPSPKYRSSLTIASDSESWSSNLSITCEAAVRNRNFTVNKQLTIQIQAYRPEISSLIRCRIGNTIQYHCWHLHKGDYSISWSWHNEAGKNWTKEDSNDADQDLSFTSCPSQIVYCRATLRNGLFNFYRFHPEDCAKRKGECSNTTTTIITSPPTQSASLQTLIIGISVSIGVCLLLFLPLLIFLIRKNRMQKAQLKMSDEEINEFMRGNDNGAGGKASDKIDPCALFLPYNMDLEISRDKLTIGSTILGSGAFGKVVQGKFGDRTVAIKTVNKSADLQYFKALLSEIKIMSFVGRHENILELVGACTSNIRKRNVYVVFEFCENGNVLQFIRRHRNVFLNQLENDEYHCGEKLSDYVNAVTTKLSSEDLIRWSFEIASGMNFIAQSKVYHGDLAARNILLDGNLVAKVGDFGLSKQLFEYSVYVQKLECPLPLKWLAIESLRDLEFSIQSDVWSYAVCLWELFSLGVHPYPGLEWNHQSWKVLCEGQRMERPEYASTTIYKIMTMCWHLNPDQRPTFSQLKSMFEKELEKIQRTNTA